MVLCPFLVFFSIHEIDVAGWLWSQEWHIVHCWYYSLSAAKLYLFIHHWWSLGSHSPKAHNYMWNISPGHNHLANFHHYSFDLSSNWTAINLKQSRLISSRWLWLWYSSLHGLVSPDKLLTKLLGKSFPAPSLLAIQVLAWEYHLLINRWAAARQKEPCTGVYKPHNSITFYAQVIISTVFPNTTVKSRILKPVSHWQCISSNI